MHEMGVLLNIADEVEAIAKHNEIEKVYKIVLEVGALTGALPIYMQKCWGAIREQSLLFEFCELDILEVAGIGRCNLCGTEFDLLTNDGVCPSCHNSQYHVLAGNDLLIKEMEAV